LTKYDLQESYNNLQIKLKISVCESGPSTIFDQLSIIIYREQFIYFNQLLSIIYRSTVYKLLGNNENKKHENITY